MRYDGWAATTDPLHKKCVQGMLQRLFDEKQIYKDKQEGYYSVRQEQFLTDKERGPDGEFGPEWGEVEHREEENYYFRLAEHKDWLLGYLRSHPDCVTPDFRQTELINAVEKLSGDLCISRPKSRLSWGIELPFDPDYVNYVWFDALTNYISFIGYDPGAEGFRLATRRISREMAGASHHREGYSHSRARHLLADHAPRPRFSRRANAEVPRPRLVEHQRREDEQVAWQRHRPGLVSRQIRGAEALRYYLMSDIVTGKDSDFSEERIIERYQSDLANNFGNLLNRSLAMTQKYRNGCLRRPIGNESMILRVKENRE